MLRPTTRVVKGQENTTSGTQTRRTAVLLKILAFHTFSNGVLEP